jgi:hypothetical protein
MPFGSSELPLNYHPAAIIVSTAFALRPKFGSSAGGSFIAHSAASDASGQFSPDTANKKTHPPEEDVLDDIAKALATVA